MAEKVVHSERRNFIHQVYKMVGITLNAPGLAEVIERVQDSIAQIIRNRKGDVGAGFAGHGFLLWPESRTRPTGRKTRENTQNISDRARSFQNLLFLAPFRPIIGPFSWRAIFERLSEDLAQMLQARAQYLMRTLLLFSLIAVSFLQCFAQQDAWLWKTDTLNRTVSLDDFRVMLPRDAIPPLDRPRFLPGKQATSHYAVDEPVIALAIGSASRAYPVSILMWHEIINDGLNDRFFSITYCPLCNAAIVFDREWKDALGGLHLFDFGTTGMLRFSDLVMWDRQTETWWQQITGKGLVGKFAGAALHRIPAQMMSLEEFRDRWPEGMVLAPPHGAEQPYGTNPYTGYDSESGTPALFEEIPDSRLPPTERVIDVCLEGRCRVYPWSLIARLGLIQDRPQGIPVVIFYKPGTRSALDQELIANSRPIGSVGVFRAELDGKLLQFEKSGSHFRDLQTRTVWSHNGLGVSGPLKGRQLTPVEHHNIFAFAWFRFYPNSEVYSAED